jgi:hypothetical protein
MRILNNMMSSARTFTLILIMLALPLQGALAAIMPLCAQAKNTLALETRIHPITSAVSCSQHDIADREQAVSNDSTTDDMAFLPCDGVVCHISGSSLPSASSPLNLAGRFSYPVPSDSHFASLTSQQPQHPPLP